MIVLAFTGCAEPNAEPPVVINEIVGSNLSGLEDEKGQPEDWLELVNLGEEPVDLSGWSLTGAYGVDDPWPLPDGTTIAAGGFLVIFCDAQTNQGPLHADFHIAADYGNDIVLLDAEGAWADEALTGSLFPDHSWARVPDGADSWRHLLTPTPAAPNTVQAEER